jgi:hypothetical protein
MTTRVFDNLGELLKVQHYSSSSKKVRISHAGVRAAAAAAAPDELMVSSPHVSSHFTTRLFCHTEDRECNTGEWAAIPLLKVSKSCNMLANAKIGKWAARGDLCQNLHGRPDQQASSAHVRRE